MTDTLFFISFVSVSILLEHVVRDLPLGVFNREGIINIVTISTFEIKIWGKKLCTQRTVFANLVSYMCMTAIYVPKKPLVSMCLEYFAPLSLFLHYA